MSFSGQGLRLPSMVCGKGGPMTESNEKPYSNENAYKFNSQILPKLNDVCRPLFENTGVSSFRYFRIFEDSSYINLSTSEEWLKVRLEKIHDNGVNFHAPLQSAVEEKCEYYLWPDNPNDSVSKLFIDFVIWNGFSVYQRKGNSVEAWSFGADVNAQNMKNFYLNNTHIITNFVNFFKVQTPSLVDESNNDIRAHFRDKISIEPNLPVDPCKNFESNLWSDGIPIKTDQNYVLITTREFQSGFLLSRGCTVKEAAQILKISHRTVDSHLVSLKRKTNCPYKPDLIKVFIDNFDYLPKNFDLLLLNNLKK